MRDVRGHSPEHRSHAPLGALLAVALILHQLWWDGFEVASAHAVVVLAALAVLAWPRSVALFVVMVAAEVVAVALDLPLVGSHTLFTLVVGVAALAQLAVLAARGRGRPTPAATHDALAPFLRTSLLVVYGFAALAKLNTGFLDPATSCAGPMSRAVAWFDPALLDGPWRVGPAIAGTVVAELALPVLLALRRTRTIGVVVGGVFHVVLALAGNVPFSALAFAFYVLFLPPATQRWLATHRYPVPARVAVLVGGLAAWGGGAVLEARAPETAAVLIGDGTRLVVAVLAVLGAVALFVTRREPAGQRGALRVGGPVVLAGLLVLVVNGASPYLGLKTDASFEMFSNLRTEPGAWNHLLVPETVRVFGTQQPVRVLAADDPALVARGGGPDLMVLTEVERALRARPGTTATLAIGDGAPVVLGPLPADPSLTMRLALFRDLPPPGVPRC